MYSIKKGRSKRYKKNRTFGFPGSGMFCVCWLLFCYGKADRQARAWHEVTASNAPSMRNGHTSVIDAQQRIWIFGGYKSGLSLKILAAQCVA
jgi:hypothetical protein